MALQIEGWTPSTAQQLIKLSPLYDLAPTILDGRGIARVCRWQDNHDYPDWAKVVTSLAPMGLDASDTRRWLRELAAPVGALTDTMKDCGVPELVIERCTERVARVARSLEKVPT